MKPHILENDYLTLTNGTYCRCSKGWHGKDEAWITVQYQREGLVITRDVESFQIAHKSPPPE